MSRARALFSSVVLLAVVLASSAVYAGSDQSKDVAKIGVFLPLTGNLAGDGVQIDKAIKLYVEQYNKGEHKYKIELVTRDDRGQPKTATNIAREFAFDNDMIAAVGSFTSTASMAAAPILIRAGIPQLSPTSSHPRFTKMGKCIFRGTPTQEIEATLIAKYFKNELGVDNAAIVYRQDDWGNAASKAFAKAFTALGGKIVATKAAYPNLRDFRTVVTALKKTDPQGIYVALHYSQAAVLARQLHTSGWNPTVITSTALYTQELIDLAGADNVEGWVVPSFFFAGSNKQSVGTFVDAFDAKYEMKPNAFSFAGYDLLTMIGAALDKIDTVGKAGRDALCKALYTVKTAGVTGQLQFNPNGDITKQINWLAIHDGQFEELD